MFQDLIALFSGWYQDYVEAIRDLISYDYTSMVAVPGDYEILTDTVTNKITPEIWSAFVPWEHIIAAVVLIVFVVCIFKLLRSLICKIL